MPALPVQRLSKAALLLAIAFFFTLVVFNNLTDYDSNFQFVRHVLSMDTTFPGNHGLWRALPQPLVHKVFYASIICWETLTALLCWAGAIRLLASLRSTPAAFDRAKTLAIAALTCGSLLWLIAFLSVGAEWFLMWQSATWNGQEAAFRMLTAMLLILIYISRPEPRDA